MGAPLFIGQLIAGLLADQGIDALKDRYKAQGQGLDAETILELIEQEEADELLKDYCETGFTDC